MSTRTRFVVRYLDRTARFSDYAGAIRFARSESEVLSATVEVTDPTGLIAQFDHGKATPEFEHLDPAPNPPVGCPDCNTFFTRDEIYNVVNRTWQQWECSCCGSWVDHTDATR